MYWYFKKTEKQIFETNMKRFFFFSSLPESRVQIECIGILDFQNVTAQAAVV